LVPLAGFKTITRNTAWKSDKNLFLTDVQTVPRSIMANNNAASACIEMGDSEKDSLKARDWYLKGITYANNTLQLDSLYVNGYLNKGVCSYKVGLADSAMVYWGKVRILYPNHPSLAYFYNIIANYYFMQGNAYGKNNNNEAAIVSFKKGIEATPMAPDMWFNYGYANMLTGRFPEALRAYEMALKFEPGNKKTLYNIELCKAAMAQLPPRK
jgi:tetratricopeptide (TPR) repeat protein